MLTRILKAWLSLLSYMRLIFVSLLCSFSLSALAADPFIVAGVPVDAQGSTAIEAQTSALTDGQVRAAQLLFDRLTLPGERSGKSLSSLPPEAIQPLIRAMEIANEKRSANRYLGDIMVAFNPSEVQKFLQNQGLRMITTQARERLVIPVLNGQALWSSNPWFLAWTSDAHTHSLTPMRGLSLKGERANLNLNDLRRGNMDALKRLGRIYGVDQILIAEARQGSTGLYVKLTDIALDTEQTRTLPSVSGYDFATAANAVVSSVEERWKQASISIAENARSMTVTVLYNSQLEWQRLQDAINGSAQIQDARLDALSKDGALMTLIYGGNIQKLSNELALKGVDVKRHPEMGIILSRTGRF